MKNDFLFHQKNITFFSDLQRNKTLAQGLLIIKLLVQKIERFGQIIECFGQIIKHFGQIIERFGQIIKRFGQIIGNTCCW